MAATATAFPLTGPINLMVRIGHGSVTVAARDGLTEATVGLAPRQPGTHVTDRVFVGMHGPTLVVAQRRHSRRGDSFGGWRRGRDEIDVTIEIPTGTAVKIATAGADISVTGRCGGADVATGAANISLEALDGDLRLRYGTGECRIGTVTGSVHLRAGAGSAHLAEVGGRLECGFGSGELVADVVRGDVRSRASSGSAEVGAAYGDVDIASGSGSITLGVPAGISARLSVTTGSGQLQSDLPVEQGPAPGARTITVRARTGSGNVRLQRAAA